MTKVSIIIPCYNQGAYLEEAVKSVQAQTFQDFEILVVDDGSTDEETLNILKDYARPKTRVIRTENQGLSAARNNGILEAIGEYILPLDADDKIGPGYLEDAVHILDRHPDIGIVYCEAAYFGIRDGHWPLPDYSPDQLLLQNVIFCSALFRRSHWEKVGGFNVNMVYGWEDWDFWLALIRLGVKVYRIPKVHFFYRLQETSMVHAMDDEKRFFMKLHVVLNQKDLYRKVAEINIHTKVAELFLDTGLGFTPREVIRQVVFGEERMIEFDLSTSGWIRQVRFHPLNVPLVLRLDRIEATDELGCCRTLTPGQSNALWQDGSHWIFQADHPWMTFDLSSVTNPRKFSIHFQYLAIGCEVYPEILKVREQEGIRMLQMKDQEVKSLQETIRQKNEMIEDLMNSTSWRLTRPLRGLKEILKP
jgi:glycosyltransferase involved in cell wall biosynthesis